MELEVIRGVLIPFAGTSLGAACVLFMKRNLNIKVQKALTGFAAGVMVAASIWSLLLPAIEQGASLGVWRFIPAAIGFWIGILFLMAIDYFAPPECIEGEQKDNLLLAVTLHNIPEGMAVGVIYAGLLNHADHITAMGAFSLALGIAIQNFPEGAIISMPLCTKGMPKGKAFVYAFRGSRTGGIRVYFMGSQSGCSGSSVFFKFCSGSDALCRCGGTCSENVSWRNNKYRHFYVCGRV